MVLKEEIEERLWNFIKKNYNSEHYSNAILDSIQFLGDIIREKSGLESDGQSLIGEAFGGKNPKIKLNKLKTESEKNIQKGTENILRGIYSSYRNPRSHSKVEDSENGANEIIIFINHLLKQIDQSKGRFTIDQFLDRVFDEDFVPSSVYADLLVKEIPKPKLFEIAIEIYSQKTRSKITNLKLIWHSLQENLSKEEKKELAEIASEELRYTDSLNSVVRSISLFKNDWLNIENDARLRAENKLIKCIPLAEKNVFGQTNEYGKYATYIKLVDNTSLLKPTIAQTVYDSLASRIDDRQRYILDFFNDKLEDFERMLTFDSFQDLFIKELQNGNKLIFDFVTFHYDGKELEPFKEYVENFKDAEIDELPF